MGVWEAIAIPKVWVQNVFSHGALKIVVATNNGLVKADGKKYEELQYMLVSKYICRIYLYSTIQYKRLCTIVTRSTLYVEKTICSVNKLLTSHVVLAHTAESNVWVLRHYQPPTIFGNHIVQE